MVNSVTRSNKTNPASTKPAKKMLEAKDVQKDTSASSSAKTSDKFQATSTTKSGEKSELDNVQINANLPKITPDGKKVPTFFKLKENDYRELSGEDRTQLGADNHRRAIFHIMGRQNITTGKPSDGSIYRTYIENYAQQQDASKDKPVLEVLTSGSEPAEMERIIRQEYFESGGFITGKVLERDFFAELKALSGDDLSELAKKNPGAPNNIKDFEGSKNQAFQTLQQDIALMAQSGLNSPIVRESIRARINSFKRSDAFSNATGEAATNYQKWVSRSEIMLTQGMNDDAWRTSAIGLMHDQGIQSAGFPVNPETGKMMTPDDPGFNEALGLHNGKGADFSAVMQLWGHDLLTASNLEGTMLDGDSVLIALQNRENALDRNIGEDTLEVLLQADMIDDGIRNGSALSRNYLNAVKEVYGATSAATTIENALIDAHSVAINEMSETGRTFEDIYNDMQTGVGRALEEFTTFAKDHPFITAGGLTTMAGAAAVCPYLAGLGAAGAGIAAMTGKSQNA